MENNEQNLENQQNLENPQNPQNSQTQNTPTTPSTPNKTTNPNEMTLEEQVKYYKDLFIKSKKLILHNEENNKSRDELVKSLKNKLKQYEAEDGKTCEFLFKFKYENSCFFFFKSDKSYYFVNEKILEESFRNNLNSNENIKTYDFVKDLKSKDETFSQIINQYEDKMQRLIKENENTEKRIKDTNTKLKNLMKEMEEMQNNFENEKKTYEQSIKEIIQVNSEIVIQMKNTLEVDLTDDSLQDEVYNKIKEMIINTTKVADQTNSKWLNELRSHLSKNLLTFLDVIFKQLKIENNFSAQKMKWQNTLDQISLSHEEELNKSFKLVDTHKIHINNLNQKISNLEQEKYNIAKQKDQTIEILSKELNKGVNINYLRNVFISFLTSKEESIQDGLLPVIYTALQFNESEIKKVLEVRTKKTTGILGFFAK